MSLCTARVWASGDTDPCGEPAVIADRCLYHRNHELHALREAVHKLQAQIRSHAERIAVLTEHDAEDTHALASSRL